MFKILNFINSIKIIIESNRSSGWSGDWSNGRSNGQSSDQSVGQKPLTGYNRP